MRCCSTGAGLGSCLRLVVLWEAGLGPQLRPCDLDEAEIASLAAATLDLPRRSYRTRGKGGAGPLQDIPSPCHVHERGGEDCLHCLSPIEESIVASRALYACPRCPR